METLTAPKLLRDRSINFPAVILIGTLDTAIIKVRPRAVL